MVDSREVGYSAQEHTDLVGSILAESVLKPHNIFRHVDVAGKRVIDIGCGDGAMSRKSVRKGASKVLGIDGKTDMIMIALKENAGFEKHIDYILSFIEDLKGNGSFDVAILSYLLNNAKSFDQLASQCRVAAEFLKPGGVAVVYNNNPFDTVGGDFSKYGFRKNMTGLEPGSPIFYDYWPAISDMIINYYFDSKSHEEVLSRAGFSEIEWKPLELYPGADAEFWHDYFDRDHLPVIGLVARK
ncbi:methyltransferase domain-containing protein [Candidatus Woesearchaeota archaeon]|nr:methyltransferase domain-containing protein [Candidatus Woesearchaeota archaeon]